MLQILDLSKTYPNGVRALRGVGLQIPRGMFGLLGPNGAGKSTLMRTLATLQRPDSGQIVFDGIDALAQPREIRRRLGYLPQELGVYPRISARALLDHLAVLKGITDRRERRDAVGRLLELTNLESASRRSLATFSGGMRQRFGIAQALLGDPDLLIVDEPTAGLDPEERQRFLNLLSAVGENVVVILSTHIVGDVRDLCSRVAVLSEGRVLLVGEPDAIVLGLRGRVWRKTASRDEVVSHRRSFDVLSTRLFAGRTIVHVYSESDPGDGFEPVEADLGDAYFAALKGHTRAA